MSYRPVTVQGYQEKIWADSISWIAVHPYGTAEELLSWIMDSRLEYVREEVRKERESV